ncbi:MAG: hypothetical protein J5755_02565, partial [Clostridia bacterium]|nr:hypothetical protein [Clostridia bacterium]
VVETEYTCNSLVVTLNPTPAYYVYRDAVTLNGEEMPTTATIVWFLTFNADKTELINEATETATELSESDMMINTTSHGYYFDMGYDMLGSYRIKAYSGSNYVETASFTLYEGKAYVVSYNANGGTGSIASIEVGVGASLETPSEDAFGAPACKEFDHYAIVELPGRMFGASAMLESVNSDLTVYPVWRDGAHTPVAVAAHEASCDEEGNIAHYRCSVCGKLFSDETCSTELQESEIAVAKLGHTWGEWFVVTPATTKSLGLEKRVCTTNEAHFETRDIPKISYVHNEVDGREVYSQAFADGVLHNVSDLFQAAKTAHGEVTLDFGVLQITFDANAAAAIGGKEAMIIAEIVSDDLPLPGAQFMAQISLRGAKFVTGLATVTIPFSTPVPQGKAVKVYYVDEAGNKTDMNARFEDGKVVFTTNHFSDFVVVFEDVAVASPAKEGPSGGTIAGIIIGVLLGVALVACLVLLLLHVKGVLHLAFLDKLLKKSPKGEAQPKAEDPKQEEPKPEDQPKEE